MNPAGLASLKKRTSAALNSSPAQPRTIARGPPFRQDRCRYQGEALFPSRGDTPTVSRLPSSSEEHPNLGGSWLG